MSKRNNYSDSELLKLLTLKGEEGMDAIFRQYYAYLCKVVVRILTQEQIAEDIVQDVFYDLWKKREVLHVSISLKAYLRRAAVNKSLNYIRDRKVKWDDEEHLVLQKKS